MMGAVYLGYAKGIASYFEKPENLLSKLLNSLRWHRI